jgi:D-glycero-alpha-D-manno-heptose 1-phosphate guanylyltransferase
VNGLPFLHYVIAHLRRQGVEHFVFSLGYLGEQIMQYLATREDLHYTTVTEASPLGTGGAIQLACGKAHTAAPLICNGDTLFMGDVQALAAFHQQQDAECTLALKPMKDFDRYGVVETAADGRIRSFREKQYFAEGSINAGMYILNRSAFLSRPFPERFSFEKEYLEKEAAGGVFYGLEQDAYFIDIGIPEDYERAQTELIPFV